MPMGSRQRLAGTPVLVGGLALAALLLEGASCQQGGVAADPAAAPSYDASYRARWRDGKAELAGYSLRYPRYGELRRGTAVMITVTEPFDPASRVKPEKASSDHFQAIKLNLIQDFATGIYDYNMMTSAFVATDPVLGRAAGSTTKVSFSSQEWCGHVYAQLLFDADAVRLTSHSYFEAEADESRKLVYPRQGLSEDTLPLWARGLAGPALVPGQSIRVPLLGSLVRTRLKHVPLSWDSVTLTRHAGTQRLAVPAGSFEVERLTAETAGEGAGGTARVWTFLVEKAHPRRVVSWLRDDGLTAELLGAKRLAYWQLQKEGHDKHLKDLGLTPRSPAMP